ncbi:cytochrome P450 [Mycena albidolilacea]|uniref:Cytochrome P450 n=1 Tax=Mycena albidolilacea TaxID=1033008 RepID=A0AAD7A2A3_9AGAR|nr:cytochrome P450 [Mycena albidolilacea]
MSWWLHLSALFAFYIVHRVLEFKKNKLSHLPGLRSMLAPMAPWSSLLPTTFWNPGLSWQWNWRNQVYSKFGLQTISTLGFLDGRPSIFTISLDVASEFLSLKGRYHKGEETTSVLRLWGGNLFTENGSEWSRHRRIMNPAFSPETYALVWDEGAKLYQEMMEGERWDDENDVLISAINPITSKFALIIIGRCGFGEPLSWRTTAPESGMSLSEALAIVSATSIARMVIPWWIYKLPIKRLRDIETAYTSLDAHMKVLIASRQEEVSNGKEIERKDVCRLMMRANEGQGTLSMTDEELVGNTYLMLVAGHDTTARTLDAAVGLLALYEDIQEEVHDELQAVISTSGKIDFKDIPRLVKVQACFLEASRLFPAASAVTRTITETIVLKTDEEDGHGGQIILEPGTMFFIDLVGLHYNPKYFPDPEEFRPSRWYGTAESDMTTFSLGPRICIGRRFALTEAVVFLTSLLRDWRLQIVLDPGETKEQWRGRVLKATTGLTLGVGKVPVRLTRR